MTLVFSDDFAGSGAWDSAKWTTIASGAATFTRVGGYGQIVTPAAGSYNDKLETRTATSATGEFRYDFTVDDKTEYEIGFFAAVSGAAPATWGWYPQYGYIARYAPVSNQLSLQRSDNYALATLGTLTFSSVVSDVLHFAVKPGTGLFVWKNAAARPTSPTIASTDTTYTSGYGGIGAAGGNAATAHTLRVDNVALEDFPQPSDFYAVTAGGLVPLTLSFA